MQEAAAKQQEASPLPDYNTLARHVLDAVRTASIPEAFRLADSVISKIHADPSSLQGKGENLAAFIDALIDQILSLEYVTSLSISSESILELSGSSAAQHTPEELFQKASEICHDLIQGADDILTKQKNPYIINAREYITAHFDDPDLWLTSVAQTCDINPSYLSRLIKANLGITFTDLVSECRIKKSMEYLKDTDNTVKNIAEKVGFSSVQTYNRVFKKMTGMTPIQFREKQTQKQKDAEAPF